MPLLPILGPLMQVLATTPIDGDAVTDMYPFLGVRARNNDPDY